MISFKVKKDLGVKAVILMVLTSCLSIRWVAVAGSIGHFAIIMWILAALVFFIPLAIIVIELSLNFPENGGIALWISKGLGDKLGFYGAWFYWINNVVYYPGALVFIAVNIAYLIGYPDLATDRQFIVSLVIICFWLAVLFNLLGLGLLAKLTNLAGLLNFRLGVFLVIAGIYYLISFKHGATSFSISSWLPLKQDLGQILANFSILMFALAGIEAIPSFYKSINNPQQNLVRAIMIGGALLLIIYISATLAINFILSPQELTNTTGVIASLQELCAKLHWPLVIANLLVLSLIIVEFGSLNLWLISSSVVFFESTKPGVLPGWLQQLNHNYVPANALIFQGVLVSCIIIMTKFLPSVEAIYLLLIFMATIIYFLPYLLLSIAYYNLRKSKQLTTTIISKPLAYILAACTFVSVGLSILLNLIPSSEFKTGTEILIYELELIGGPIIFILFGILIYYRNQIKAQFKRVVYGTK